MKKLKTEKGITLIALIITIIVLLILAMVAISAVTGDGILSYAKKAKENYLLAQENEQATLQGYLDKIQENFPMAQIISTTENYICRFSCWGY